MDQGIHQMFHTVFGFCMWDALGVAILAVMAIVLVVHITKQKKRQKALEQQLAANQAAKVSSDTSADGE